MENIIGRSENLFSLCPLAGAFFHSPGLGECADGNGGDSFKNVDML
jgi:hypothetical protein